MDIRSNMLIRIDSYKDAVINIVRLKYLFNSHWHHLAYCDLNVQDSRTEQLVDAMIFLQLQPTFGSFVES